MNSDLQSYYRDRAGEYEKIYSRPERQDSIGLAIYLLHDIFRNREVIEIACGTGFWTQFIAQSATSLLAIDINAAMLEMASKKGFTNPQVRFEMKDFFNFQPEKKFQGLFGGFIWSHIPKQELGHFLKTLKNLVLEDGSIVLMDNLYVEGSNHAITRTDEAGNTYQTRQLEDGSKHEILKNFATESFFREQLKGHGKDLHFYSMKYFWIATFKPTAS